MPSIHSMSYLPRYVRTQVDRREQESIPVGRYLYFELLQRIDVSETLIGHLE